MGLRRIKTPSAAVEIVVIMIYASTVVARVAVTLDKVSAVAAEALVAEIETLITTDMGWAGKVPVSPRQS